MMNEQKNNSKNLEIFQKQIIMMGGDIKKEQQKLSPEVIKQIEKNYRQMYIGFTSINWGMGKTLGVSWQKALEQMDSFVASKTKIANHPVNNALVKIHKEFRSDMARFIMQSPHAENKLSERLKKDFIDDGTKSLKQAKDVLENIYKRYNPTKESTKQFAAVKFNFANRNLQQILMRQYQRTA